MAVVVDKMIGNCHVIIHDDHMVKTEEEKKKVLDEIADICTGIYIRKAQRERAAAAKVS